MAARIRLTPAMEATGVGAVSEPVPAALKTMRMDRVFWSHFSPNLGPGGWVTGVLLVHLGLDFRWGLLAILSGNLIGAVPVALAATIGPVTGLPQMEASRHALGRAGLRLPALLNWICCVGWDAVNNVPAAAALIAFVALAGPALPFWLALGVLAAIQMLAGIYGHDAVQALQKYLGGLLLVVLAGVGLLVLQRAGSVPAAPHPPSAATLVLATAILASFNLSWASYSSDYTRYLPADAPPGRVALLALAGLLGSAIPFQLLGLLTAGAIGEASPTAVIGSLQHGAGLLGPLVLAAIALSSITGNALNDNTASYSLISAGFRVPRVWAAIVTAVLGYVLAVAGAGRYAELYTSYLVVILYWIAPWIGIVLADWFMTGERSRRDPPGWTQGATIFLVTTGLTVALFSSSDLYTGPVARLLGGADIGYYVGFLAALLWYAAAARTRRAPPRPTSGTDA